MKLGKCLKIHSAIETLLDTFGKVGISSSITVIILTQHIFDRIQGFAGWVLVLT